MLLLDEPFTISTVAGFALVATGCWLSTRPTPAAGRPPQPAPGPECVIR